MSPVQKPLKRPQNIGTVELVETQGCIIVKYKFLSAEVMDADETAWFN